MPAQLVVPEHRERRVRHHRAYDVTRDHDAQASGGDEISEHEIVGEMRCASASKPPIAESTADAKRIGRAQAVSRRAEQPVDEHRRDELLVHEHRAEFR